MSLEVVTCCYRASHVIVGEGWVGLGWGGGGPILLFHCLLSLDSLLWSGLVTSLCRLWKGDGSWDAREWWDRIVL